MKEQRSISHFPDKVRGLGVMLLLAGLAIGRCDGGQLEQWREKMEPIVPEGYLCRHAATPILVDGKLDDDAWADAPWTADFVDIQGAAKPKPRFRTRAKMLWDADYLYVAAEIEEPHVRASLTQHDPEFLEHPNFEVFLNPTGDTRSSFQFEINALNTCRALKLLEPGMDEAGSNPAWDIPGLKTAVHVNATISNSADAGQGWTLEIAFPWKALSSFAPHPGPPAQGEQWRVNFSRNESHMSTDGGLVKQLPGTPEDNWVWSPQGVADMHRPEMWGQVQFTHQPTTEEIVVAPIPAKPARDLALEIYYAQQDFRNSHGRWAANLAELNWTPRQPPPGLEQPNLEPTPNGYDCSVAFNDGGHRRVWRIRQDRLLQLDPPVPLDTAAFIAAAGAKFGDVGRRAASFLVDNMPAGDLVTLNQDYLMENLSLALQARRTFPWAGAVPEEIFFNDVLPYASLDEPRDPWRADFYRRAYDIVRDCTTATEAAEALNRDFFKQINVHYNTGRKRRNQSPMESIGLHKATCTALSIILVDACRSVGVPARIAGVPDWSPKKGDKVNNHTWVEIWDGDWFFTGADEYSKAGLNKAWFTGPAAISVRSPNPLSQVYATSWQRTGQYFPMAWDFDSRQVPAVLDSARYEAPEEKTIPKGTVVQVRLRDKPGGQRLSAVVELRLASGQLLSHDHTRAGTADINDMPDFTLPDHATTATFRFVRNGEAREAVVSCAACVDSHTLDFVWSDLSPSPLAIGSK